MNKRIEVLEGILAIDSTNGNEALVSDYLAAVLATAGIASNQLQYADQRTSLIAQIGTSGVTLALSGHMDVVSAGDVTSWTSPPFIPTTRDGNLYARGASDMKSGLAAMVMAMVELQEEQTPLNGSVKLLATVGEEIGMLGAKQLTDEGYVDGVDAMIIGEPTGHRIIFAHKGVFTYKVTSIGKSAHSSMPENGINAIDHLIQFYNTIQAKFERLTASNSALGPFIVNNSIIAGGNQINSVPEQASLIANLRTIPEVDNAQVQAILEATVNELNTTIPNMNLVLEITQSTPPIFSPTDSKLVQVAKMEADKQFGEDVPLLGMPGGADSAEFIRANKDMEIIIFGPGNETLHQVDEYVNIDNYLEMVDLYKKIILAYVNK